MTKLVGVIVGVAATIIVSEMVYYMIRVFLMA
jgi:large-conductance mechanosensitive channel